MVSTIVLAWAKPTFLAVFAVKTVQNAYYFCKILNRNLLLKNRPFLPIYIRCGGGELGRH